MIGLLGQTWRNMVFPSGLFYEGMYISHVISWMMWVELIERAMVRCVILSYGSACVHMCVFVCVCKVQLMIIYALVVNIPANIHIIILVPNHNYIMNC